MPILDLSKMTKDELLRLADTIKIPVKKAMLKGEILTVLKRETKKAARLAEAKKAKAKTVKTTSIDVNLFYNIGRTFMIPNLKINMGAYETRVSEGISAISNTKGIVDQGEIIIRSGSKVSKSQEETLVEMAKILRAQAADEGWLVTVLPALAKVLLVLFAFSLLFMFLLYFRRDVFA